MSRSILFVHNHRSRFVQTDLTLLAEQFVVQEWYQRSRRIDLGLLAKEVAQHDLVFGWFASWHTFFPVLFARRLRRPAVLVVGGYDTANLPGISYGSQRGGVKRLIARWTMQHSTCLVVNSNFIKHEVIRNVGIAPRRIRMVYHGVELPSCPAKQKEAMVVTVGGIIRENFYRKGLMPFVRAAALVPQVPFLVVGGGDTKTIDVLKKTSSPNVTCTTWLGDMELDELLCRAKVYVQASQHEGFGLAVAEAMLKECIPVVTRAGALPEVVGDTGVYLETVAPEQVAKAVELALALGPDRGAAARERIVQKFPLELRRRKLGEIVQASLDDARANNLDSHRF